MLAACGTRNGDGGADRLPSHHAGRLPIDKLRNLNTKVRAAIDRQVTAAQELSDAEVMRLATVLCDAVNAIFVETPRAIARGNVPSTLGYFVPCLTRA